MLPAAVDGSAESPGVTPETIRDVNEYVEENREADDDFDIVWEGQTPGEDSGRADSILRPFMEAGATWWIESMWTPPNEPEDLRVCIEQGPTRVG